MMSAFNRSILRECVCAQCWGELVERMVEGEVRLECHQRCQPGGFVSRIYVERQREQAADDLNEVAANYPALDTRPKPDHEAMRAALFGK